MAEYFKDYVFPNELWHKYEGQPLFRGDAVKADVYFSDGKDIRVCELLKRHKNNWYAWDLKGKRQVLIDKDMVLEILHDEWYSKRRNQPEKHKFYWETRGQDD